MGIAVGLISGFIAIIVGLVFLFRYILDNSSKKLIASNAVHDGLIKKQPVVDANRYSGLFFNLGIILTLALCYFIFELKQYEEKEIVELGANEAIEENVIDIPVTEQKPPPPPTIVMPEIVAVSNDQKIEETKINLSSETSEEVVIEKAVAPEVVVEEVKEEVEEIFQIVEDPAKPVGEMTTFYKYVGKSLTYPSQAKRMGVEGKVYIQFVVDKDGSLTDVKVMKGIGAGCDEEAARVIKEAPKWIPGKQRGKAVKQRIVMPITFKLG
ncbi:MAG: energy transducer TonB [Bacteroidetes bacterium]|nr:MAG: energy transducer TonB [Bacteroidota bacterium]